MTRIDIDFQNVNAAGENRNGDIPGILGEMRELIRIRSELLHRMERAESLATSSGGIGDGMPRGTPTEPKLQRLCIELADLGSDLSFAEQRLKSCRAEVEPMIAALPAGTARMMLRLRYIDWLPVGEVAFRAGYNRQHAYRALQNAERLLAS